MENSKILFVSGMLALLILVFSMRAHAQAEELQQLLLNVEKLTQLKAILKDMKTGYQIYKQGYGTISSLSKGNFNLHNVYLTGLLSVNPLVSNDPRVGQIMLQQRDLISEYQRYNSLFIRSDTFSAAELSYIQLVYQQLLKESNSNIDELSGITTAGQLRMSDDDRLRAIDRISNVSMDQVQFLRWFNRQAVILSLQRSRDRTETQTLKRLYGIN